MPVIHKNPKFWKEYADRLKKMKGVKLYVGYPADDSGVANPHYENGASIIDVAIANNYGLGVPQRPFFEEAREPIQRMFESSLKSRLPDLNSGKADYKKLLGVIGVKAENEVRRSIRDGNWTPNSPETVARKGSDRPLIDTGAMIQNVTHIVKE